MSILIAYQNNFISQASFIYLLKHTCNTNFVNNIHCVTLHASAHPKLHKNYRQFNYMQLKLYPKGSAKHQICLYM